MRSATPHRAKRTYNIELVDKLVRLLETLRDHPDGIRLQDLAASTGYIKSSIHRTLNSLKRHGYVEQSGSRGAYRLGTQFLSLTRGLGAGTGLVPQARPYLQELVDTFDESAYLAILRGGRGIFVDVVETRHRELRLVGPLGADAHYHATAAGKVMAAALSPAGRQALLARIKLTRLTDKTLTSRAAVMREWVQVARRGFAVNDEETIVGAFFAAAPVLDAQRANCGSISVGVPKPRYSAVLGRRIAAQVKDAAERLSRALEAAGYVHDERLEVGVLASA